MNDQMNQDDERIRAYELSQNPQTRAVMGSEFHRLLERAGIFRPEDRVRRVVIDAAIDEPLILYVERFGDARMLEIASSLDGIEMRVVNVEDLGDPQGPAPKAASAESSEYREPSVPGTLRPGTLRTNVPTLVYKNDAGICPGCGASQGATHQESCFVRKALLDSGFTPTTSATVAEDLAEIDAARVKEIEGEE